MKLLSPRSILAIMVLLPVGCGAQTPVFKPVKVVRPFKAITSARFLEFSNALENGQLVATDGSRWDGVTGEKIREKGTALKPMPGIISFAKAWRKFHPATSWAK